MIRKLLNTVWSTVANDTQRQMPRNSTCWVVYKITLYLHCHDDNWVKQAGHLVPVCHQATLAPRGGVWKEDGTLGRKMVCWYLWCSPVKQVKLHMSHLVIQNQFIVGSVVELNLRSL